MLYHHTLKDLNGSNGGKDVIGLLVTYPPLGGTPPHTHGGAHVFAAMLKGRCVSQTVCPGQDPDSQGSLAKIYGAGDSWYEPPGCRHVRSHNASDQEEAQFQVTFIVDTERVQALGWRDAVIQIDAENEQKGKEQR